MSTWSTVAHSGGSVERVSGSAFEEDLAGVLGRRLRALRDDRGLTQEQVAHSAGISRNHDQLLESGLSDRRTRKAANPNLATLVALSEVLGTTVPELVTEMFAADPDERTDWAAVVERDVSAADGIA